MIYNRCFSALNIFLLCCRWYLQCVLLSGLGKGGSQLKLFFLSDCLCLSFNYYLTNQCLPHISNGNWLVNFFCSLYKQMVGQSYLITYVWSIKYDWLIKEEAWPVHITRSLIKPIVIFCAHNDILNKRKLYIPGT